MTVKDRSGHWIIDTIWPDGRRTRRQTVSEKQAKELDLRIRASRIDGTWQELRTHLFGRRFEKELTLREACELYMTDYCQGRNKSLRSKRSRLAILEREFGPDAALQSIDAVAVARYASMRRKAGISARTINRDIAVLRHMITWAVPLGYLEQDPLVRWDRLREEEYHGRRPTEEAIEAVLAQLDDTVRPLFEFIRETGCRREEALSLKHQQLDLRNQVAAFTKTKSGRARQVPLTERALAAIAAMPRAETDYVFYQPETLTRWSEAKGPWNRARVAAGYPWLRIHDLRHAFAIRLAEAGCPMHFIAKVLGHANGSFTEKQYAKFSPESAARAVLAVLEGGKGKEKKQA